MEKRKGAVVFLWVLIGLFLAVTTWLYFSYQLNPFMGGMTGNSVREVVNTFYETSSINQRIFILSQVLLLIVICAVIFMIVKKFRVKQKLFKNDYIIKGGNKRSRTDLDVLYEMLKKKKEISMEDIEKVFRIDPEIALDWSKILENGDFAEIDYPRFGKPVLRLLEEDGEKENVAEEKESGKTVSPKKKDNLKDGKNIDGRDASKNILSRKKAPVKRTSVRKSVHPNKKNKTSRSTTKKKSYKKSKPVKKNRR